MHVAIYTKAFKTKQKVWFEEGDTLDRAMRRDEERTMAEGVGRIWSTSLKGLNRIKTEIIATTFNQHENIMSINQLGSFIDIGCLSSFPIPLLLSEASLPPLRITLTHFTFLSYKLALRLPISFTISGLASLEVKPRLCRSSWRAFASTHPLMLPSTCSREALLACPPFAPWNLPFFTVEPTLSSPCSCSDLPLSLAKVQLSPTLTLSPHDLVLWTDGSVSFPFGKNGSSVLANCSLCGTEATLSFSAGPVCSSFFAEACAILHALCWSRQHQQVCHFSSLFLLSDSRSVLTILSSPSSFLLSQTLWQIWQELPSLSSCSIRLQWIPGHSFLPGNDEGDELAKQGALLAPSAIPCSLSPLISRMHSSLISDWGSTVSSKLFDTQAET